MIKKAFLFLLALLAIAAVTVFVMYQKANPETGPLDDAARASAPGEFAELDDGKTHYELAGPAEAQVVVLVHGFSVPYYIWDTTIAALTDAGFRVLRFDTYGRGYSDRPDADYNGELFERQLVNLVDTLGLREPVDIIGLSMGGAVSMRFVANNPERVRKIVLVDPTYDAWPRPPFPEALADIILTLSYVPGMAEGQLTDFVYPGNYPQWVDAYRVQMQYTGFRRAIFSTLYHFGPEDHFANYQRVQSYDKPVKLIWGVEDQTIDFAGAEVVRGVLDVDLLAVEDAGHLPHIEKPGIVNPAIIEFLRATD